MTRLELREKIREIWRPLLDMTDAEKKNWTAQGMAYNIGACVDETEHLIDEYALEVLEDFRKNVDSFEYGYDGGEKYLKSRRAGIGSDKNGTNE